MTANPVETSRVCSACTASLLSACLIGCSPSDYSGCEVVMEAVQKWRTEESPLSGDKRQLEEEEESIYSIHYEEVKMEVSWCCRKCLSWKEAMAHANREMC